MGYEPKKLEWSHGERWWKAKTPFSQYHIDTRDNTVLLDGWEVVYRADGPGPPKSLEEAKRVCQQDYDRRWKEGGVEVKTGPTARDLFDRMRELGKGDPSTFAWLSLMDEEVRRLEGRVTVKENQTEGDDDRQEVWPKKAATGKDCR